jgi:Uma2 family endonuclease
MTAQSHQRKDVAEYLQLERSSDQRHEYYAGTIIALAGGSEAHSLITVNIASSLHFQLRGRPCAVHSSDMRVAILDGNTYTYPDVTVVCGDAQFTDDQRDTLVNPTVIIEVLSPSTQKRDRGYKSQKYRLLASLQEYIIIEQQSCYVEQVAIKYREPDGWSY